jgi:hypothetical protein
VTFPPDLLNFVASAGWKYAKPMPRWPHEYILRDLVDRVLFDRLVRHIRDHGYEGRFYERKITFYDEGGLTYWTRGEPSATTEIICGCPKENTYEERLKLGSLSA